jgi:predicted Holliday junction resolvase-like endonuclease
MKNNSSSVINQLQSIKGLRIECPHCEESSPISRYKLFGMYDKSYPPFAQKLMDQRIDSIQTAKDDIKERKKQLAEDKREKPQKVSISTESTNFGQLSEQILPSFKSFPYKQQDCRVLLKPVDYLVFNKLHLTGKVDSITFVDVKTGNARLTKGQRMIEKCINANKVKHEVI